MRLLDKKTINTKLQTEKKQQIDEGVFIAKKIDALRENLAILEKQQADFIDGSKHELGKAIGGLIRQKEKLERDIKAQKEVKKKLQEPLDKEWTECHNKRVQLEKWEESLYKRDVASYLTANQINKDAKELAKKIENADKRETEAIKRFNQANEFLAQRKNEYQNLIAEKEKWEQIKQKEAQTIENKKVEADNTKREYELYLDTIKKKERLLDLKLRKYV